jgi:protein TonB
MTQALGLRATSFALSTGMLGLAALAALTMTFTMRQANPLDGAPPVPVVDVTAPPPAPTPPRPRAAPPPTDEPMPSELPFTATDDVVADVDPGPASFAPGPPEITDPTWVRRPRDLARYYPRRALERGIQGEVLLSCLVTTRGALACSVASESPPNWGFGEAALRIAGDHRMVPATADGRPTEARYRMRVPFRLQ